MALLTTVLEVVGVLASIAVLLWLSTVIESRQLGSEPVVTVIADGTDVADTDPPVESIQAL